MKRGDPTKRGGAPRLSRLALVALALGAFFVFSRLFSPQPVELRLLQPSEAPALRSMELLVEGWPEGGFVYKGKESRPEAGRSILLRLRLSKGRYRLSAWPTPDAPPLRVVFEFSGEPELDLELLP